MAAPVPTPRTDPTGASVIKLRDGFSSKITFSRYPAVAFWEKQVKPPGIDGGEKIPQSTMFNVLWETFAPQSLLTLTDATCKAAYDPAVLTTLLSMGNQEDTVTITFRDQSTYCFYGYLQKFEADELVKGTQPEATITVVCTNWDYVNKVEAGPVLTSVAGT